MDPGLSERERLTLARPHLPTFSTAPFSVLSPFSHSCVSPLVQVQKVQVTQMGTASAAPTNFQRAAQEKQMREKGLGTPRGALSTGATQEACEANSEGFWVSCAV